MDLPGQAPAFRSSEEPILRSSRPRDALGRVFGEVPRGPSGGFAALFARRQRRSAILTPVWMEEGRGGREACRCEIRSCRGKASPATANRAGTNRNVTAPPSRGARQEPARPASPASEAEAEEAETSFRAATALGGSGSFHVVPGSALAHRRGSHPRKPRRLVRARELPGSGPGILSSLSLRCRGPSPCS